MMIMQESTKTLEKTCVESFHDFFISPNQGFTDGSTENQLSEWSIETYVGIYSHVEFVILFSLYNYVVFQTSCH